MVYGVLVTLKHGDITKETVDVIVNSTNHALNLDTGKQSKKITSMKYFSRYISGKQWFKARLFV